MLEISSLAVKHTKAVITDFNLKILKGEIHAIMGPNGVGKSTLAKVIMGSSDYEIINGTISYQEVVLNNLDVTRRARNGIFLLAQHPTEIDGVSNYKLLYNLAKLVNPNIKISQFDKDIKELVKQLALPEDTLERDVNVGFSGGEKKKIELLQLKVLKPTLIILDEIDSGLDIDSLNLICAELNQYLSDNKESSVLIITHYPRILKLIKPNYVHIMQQGRISKTGDISLALEIEKNGYAVTNNVLERDIYE